MHGRYSDSEKTSERYHYAICLQEDRIPIGYIDVSGGSYDLAYGFRREFWNRGIVTEAGRSVVEQLKKDGVLLRLRVTSQPEKRRCHEKRGMIYRYSYEEYWQSKGYLVMFRMYQLSLDGQTDRGFQGYYNRYPVHFVEKNKEALNDFLYVEIL